MVVMADVTAHPRIRAGVANGLANVFQCAGVERQQIVPSGGGLTHITHHATVHKIIAHMREIIFSLLKGASRPFAQAHAAVALENVGGLPSLLVEGIVIPLTSGSHHAALGKVESLDRAQIPFQRGPDLCLQAGVWFFECRTQSRFARIIQPRDHRHDPHAHACLNRLHAAFEIRKQPTFKHLIFRQPVHLHGELGNHSQNSLTAHA